MSHELRFQIRGEGGDTLELDVYDKLGESFWGEGVSAKRVRATLKAAQNVKTIKLRVNSRGGDVFDGFAIYNLLAEHPARVEADVDALAASMASVVLMAADEIRVAKSAMIMVHNPWSIAIGEAGDLRDTADLLDKIRGQIAEAYVARTGLERARVLEMMDAETWMTADEAKANGFADVVTGPKSKSKSKAMAALDLRGLERVPAFFAAAIAEARAHIDHAEPAGPAAEERRMDRDKLLAILGLGAEATDEQILGAISALRTGQAQAGELAALRAEVLDLLEMPTSAEHGEVVGRLQALRLERQGAAEREARASIERAVGEGRLQPASRATAEQFYRDHGAGALTAFLSALPQVVTTRARDNIRPPSGQPGAVGALSAEELAVAEQLGISAEDATKFKRQQGAEES